MVDSIALSTTSFFSFQPDGDLVRDMVAEKMGLKADKLSKEC